MKPFILIILSIILLGCSNITLIRRDTANETTVSNNTDDPNRIICRSEKVIGSNITQRVCRSVREIQDEEAASKRDLQREVDRINQLPQEDDK